MLHADEGGPCVRNAQSQQHTLNRAPTYVDSSSYLGSLMSNILLCADLGGAGSFPAALSTSATPVTTVPAHAWEGLSAAFGQSLPLSLDFTTGRP